MSVDSAPAQAAFAAHCGAEFAMLSDFNKEVSRDYGVLLEEVLGYRGVANRAAFVIDRERRLRYAWVAPSPATLPDVEPVLAVVRGLSPS